MTIVTKEYGAWGGPTTADPHGVPQMTHDQWVLDWLTRLDHRCTLCGHGHCSPECLPCPLHDHCIRRGPHEYCIFDHDRPGGIFHKDSHTGNSPYDIFLMKLERRDIHHDFRPATEVAVCGTPKCWCAAALEK